MPALAGRVAAFGLADLVDDRGRTAVRARLRRLGRGQSSRQVCSQADSAEGGPRLRPQPPKYSDRYSNGQHHQAPPGTAARCLATTVPGGTNAAVDLKSGRSAVRDRP
jgi:hypothetical protein